MIDQPVIRLEIEGMKHTIVGMINERMLDKGLLEDAVDRAIGQFDFQTTINRAVHGHLREQIERVTQEATREALRQPDVLKMLEVRVADSVRSVLPWA